jgi:hypothetical protein
MLGLLRSDGNDIGTISACIDRNNKRALIGEAMMQRMKAWGRNDLYQELSGKLDAQLRMTVADNARLGKFVAEQVAEIERLKAKIEQLRALLAHHVGDDRGSMREGA